MSQLDVINAKRALSVRLGIWGVTDASEKAAGFIDDLVAQGWQMAPIRESRPQPPKLNEACKVPGHEGYRAGACAGCHSDQLAPDPEEPAVKLTKDAALTAARAALHDSHAKEDA